MKISFIVYVSSLKCLLFLTLSSLSLKFTTRVAFIVLQSTLKNDTLKERWVSTNKWNINQFIFHLSEEAKIQEKVNMETRLFPKW